MPAVRHITCPQCGGTLGASGLERIVACRYCRTRSLVEADDIVPEYWISPKLDQNAARRVVQKLLSGPGLPEGLLKLTRFHSARLHFVPFHEVSARRTGTMIMTVRKEVVRRVVPEREDQGFSPTAYLAMQQEERELLRQASAKPEKDTRVVMSDVARLEPAIDLPGWSLEEAELSSFRTRADGVLQPINRKRMERLGTIHHPTLTPENIVAQLEFRAETKHLEDNTEFGEVRAKRIFYPVWRVRYQFKGRLYGATIDAVTGKVMSARAPQDDRSRVLWLIAMSALACLIPGKILQSSFYQLFTDQEALSGILEVVIGLPQLIIPAIMIGLFAIVAVLGVGWNEFRYDGEVVITGDRRVVEKLNRPENTVFDKLQEWLLKALDSSFEAARKRRREW